MNLNKIFYGTVLSAILMAVFSLYAWFQIPEGTMIPIHWNVDGEIDRYASKNWALSLMPLMTLAMAGLLKALPYLEPRRKHLERSPKLVGAVWIGINPVLWVAHISSVGTGMGWTIDIFLLISIAIGLMMMLIGNYAAKSQSMFMVGFRTPWTLSSETVWVKTHRLFGRLFMLGGVVMVVVPFIFPGPRVFFYLIMGTVMAPVLVTLVYSWWIWRAEQIEK